jgi:Protein of unknown function (DUF2950)
MRTRNMKLEAFTVRFASGFASAVLSVLLVAGFTGSSVAQEPQPRTFSSPGEAAAVLFQAAQRQDEPALEAILGAGKEVTSSRDDVEDKLEREQFSQKYQEMHRLVREPDGTTVLYIGAENWPFPVSLVSKNGAWHFDSKTGTKEITFRRVGENEATAIEVCEQFALANNEDPEKAASEDRITQFVRNLVSAGPANAGTKDFNPFHGYYFRIVNGNSAAGTYSYVSSDNNKDGLLLVAYPADYGTSGVMTFVVSKGGIVYEKDLGSKTPTLARDLKRGPNSSWHAAE